jgi:hypothetical protein
MYWRHEKLEKISESDKILKDSQELLVLWTTSKGFTFAHTRY